MTVPKPKGPEPNRANKRRRANKPVSYGLATPVKAGQAAPQPPDLGIARPHPMIAALWQRLGESVEARFYSAADWERVRLELAYGNRLMLARNRPPASSWNAFQKGLSELLISPADKRRVGIELELAAEDPAETAAVIQIAAYQDALKQSR